jgi:Putative auto-transporter adhesin, head GIN domain
MKQVVFLLSAFFLLNSCDFTSGSGNVVNEKRTVGNFTGINVGNGFEVEVKIGPVADVKIEADDNIIEHIKTEVSGGILTIKMEDMYSISNAHLKAYITVADLNSIDASGGANVKVLDVIKGNGKINFNASGGAEIDAEVEAPEVETEASGGAGIKLTGKTKNHTADASGGGWLKAADLLSETTSATASGGGSVAVYGSIRINANASSGGSVNYRGNGEVNKEESSGGSVNKD